MTNRNRQSSVLFLSVGGSDQPLRSSLRECQPDHAVFVVSDGSDGSESSVAVAETLYEAEGCPESREIVRVPPDDPDRALAGIEPRLTRAVGSGAHVTVDYTGGTKSMTSAMVLAATSLEGIRLQFMAGIRRDLDRVEDGTERPLEIPTDLIGLSQSFRVLREFVRRRNYGAAHLMLREVERSFDQSINRLGRKVPKGWRRRVDQWKKWVAIFDEWDRFNHETAWFRLRSGIEGGEWHANWFEEVEPAYLEGLKDLAECKNSPSYELLEDHWLNAKRRASLGLYDDAVTRLYRLLEACVQTRLKFEHGIDTADVPPEFLPPNLRRNHGESNPSKGVKLPLWPSVELLKSLIDSNDKFHEAMEKKPSWLSYRNRSILAHGFEPLGPGHWRTAHSWLQLRSRVLWKSRLSRIPYQQLPNRLPDF